MPSLFEYSFQVLLASKISDLMELLVDNRIFIDIRTYIFYMSLLICLIQIIYGISRLQMIKIQGFEPLLHLQHSLSLLLPHREK